MMGKAVRKQRPEMPLWWYYETDNCWQCHNRNHCNSCGILKKAIKERGKLNKKKEIKMVRDICLMKIAQIELECERKDDEKTVD